MDFYENRWRPYRKVFVINEYQFVGTRYMKKSDGSYFWTGGVALDPSNPIRAAAELRISPTGQKRLDVFPPNGKTITVNASRPGQKVSNSKDIDLTPTEEMAANAARGLELRRKHGKGGTEIGVARARDISNRKNLSPETVRRMHAFFSRHEKNKAGGEDDAGYIAWLLWGGDSGQSWAKRKVEQMDKGENQRSDTYKEIAQRLGSAAKMGVQYVAPRSPVSKPERKYRVRLESRDTGKTIDFRTMATSDADARYQADAAYGKKWEILAVIEEHARPGAKAKFGMTNAGYKALVDAIRVYGDSAPAAVVAQAKQMKQEPTEFTDNEVMAVIAKMKQARASRPGAKAKMAANEVDLWNYLSKSDVVLARQNATDLATLKRYAQMALTKPDFTPPSRAQHGPSLHAMAKDTLADIRAWEESVQRHRNRMSRPGAKARFGYEKSINIMLEDGGIPDHAYDWRNGVLLVDSEYHDRIVSVLKSYVPWEIKNLPKIQKVQMSRPGAKAKMAKWTVVMPSIPDAGTRHFDSWEQAKNYVDTKMGGFTALVSVDGKRYALKHALGQWEKFSRPGAKAKMALTEEDARKIIATIAQTKASATTWSPALDAMNNQRTFAQRLILAHQKGDTANINRYSALLEKAGWSRPGAKVANAVREGEKVSAADDAVSRKIRKLMDEGKPQKQAVAIALDLERRGEL